MSTDQAGSTADPAKHLFVARALPVDRLEPASRCGTIDVWEQARPPTRGELISRGGGADVLLVSITERLDEQALDALPRLRGISNLAVGLDNIDLDACRRRGIVVANTPGVLANSVAEMTLALMLMTARRLPEGMRAVELDRWGVWDPYWMCGCDLRGRTLGVIGAGGIGRRVAELGAAIGMDVLVHSRRSETTLADVLRRADVITLHVPLTDETLHLIGDAEFEQMRQHSVLINTSRGGVVDEAALVRALRSGRIAAAGLDVMEHEPLPHDDPLRSLPNVVLTPHIGSATVETRDAMVDLAVANASAMLLGRVPPHRAA